MSNNPTDPFLFQEEEQNDFNFKEVLYQYLAYWKWFALSFILAIICAFFFLKYQTPQYKIQSSILIKDEKKGMGQDAMLKELDLFSSNKVVDNEIEILKSYTLMEKVVKGLNLNVSYFAKQRFRDEELYDQTPVRLEMLEVSDLAYEEPLELRIVDSKNVKLNNQTIPLNEEVPTSYGLLKISLTGKSPEIRDLTVMVGPVVNVAENLIGELKVEPSSKTSSVLILTIEEAVKQKGKDILDNLIDAYNAAALEDKNKVASNTLVFIEERLKLLSGDLTLVEKNVEEFKSSEGITNISAESELFLKSVQENDLQLSQVKIQQIVLNSIEEYVRNKNGRSGTVPATLGISDPTLLSLIGQLSELEMQRERTIKLVKADNPLILTINDQLTGIRSNLYENIQSLKSNLSLTLQQLENKNKQMEAIIKTIPGKERALVDITRQQVIKNDLYVFLLEKKEETALSFASAVSDSRIIDVARSSIKPVKPVKRTVYLLFAFLGLALPIGIVYIINLLNDKIKNRKDIEKATQTPILADISYMENTMALVSNTGRSVLAEQIRAFRTNLSFLGQGKDLQNILFTSSMGGEGKSFISLNLGASLAITNKKTIILELDMRKPKLHVALNMENGLGLSNYLIGKAELKDIIHPIPGQENYFIITCGPIPPNPVELLLNDRMDELFTELRQQFDYIILDTPPVGVVTDAQILGKYADVTMFVVRHNYTPKERLVMVDKLYRERKFKNINLVFNAIKEEGRKYGYGYYQEERKEKNNFSKRLFGRKK